MLSTKCGVRDRTSLRTRGSLNVIKPKPRDVSIKLFRNIRILRLTCFLISHDDWVLNFAKVTKVLSERVYEIIGDGL